MYVCMYVCMYVYIFWILSFFRALRHHSASAADENSLLSLELALLFIILLHVPVLFFACFLYVVLLLTTHVASYITISCIILRLFHEVKFLLLLDTAADY